MSTILAQSMTRKIKEIREHFPHATLIAGNVATAEATKALGLWVTPLATNWWAYILATVIGSIVAGIIMGLIKKKVSEDPYE